MPMSDDNQNGKRKLTREDVERIIKESTDKDERVNLGGENLSEATLSKMDLSGVNLSWANLRGADLREAYLSEADLSEANLSGANLIEANLIEANLSGANLSWANLSWASLNLVDLSKANLSEANLSEANLFEADLRWANLIKADLRWADLSRANLSRAYLSEADLGWAYLRETDLSWTDFSKTEIESTVFAGLDLTETKGLNRIIHLGPSTIGLDTIILSMGKIPEAFLRGCGLSDVQIEMVKLHNPDLTQDQITNITYKIHNLLTGPAISYHSCFISYSHQDEVLAQRLYADLQEKGIRCWYAPEDLKIGDKIRPTIDQSIRVHDKLLLVLSRDSVASDWVEHEVEHALDLEIERGEPVVFPIRLDDTILQYKIGWAGKLKRERHIGDFTRWQEHNAYQDAFKRLVRSLSTQESPPLPPHLQAQAIAREKIKSLQIQLAQSHRNLNTLKEQAAIYGPAAVPLHLLNQIDREQATLADVEVELAELKQNSSTDMPQ